MSGQILLGSQLKELLAELSDSGHQHLTEAERDLLQTTCLLGEAIQSLGSSFVGIHEAACKQQRAIDELLSKVPHAPEIAEQFKAVQSEIGSHVNTAVTSLQFQDMTNQLIERTIRRVTGIRDVLGTVRASELTGLPGGNSSELARLLEGIHKQLMDQSAKLDSLLQRSVAQTGMESGEIELF